MDTLGLCITVFAVLILVLPFVWFSNRSRAIPSWPRTKALITLAESQAGSPVGSQKYAFGLHYCKAYYAFSVNGTSYEGWFALMTKDEGFDHAIVRKLQNQEVAVQYNPKNPKDSVLVESLVLGKKVIQTQGWLGQALGIPDFRLFQR